MRKMQRTCKIITLLIALTMLTAVVVSADGADYTTTTSYDMETGMVAVTSTVYGVDDGEQVTYLAYNTEIEDAPYADVNGTNIVYIDQEEADDTGSVSFTYSAAIGKFTETVVKFGAQYTTNINPDDDKDGLIKYHPVSVDKEEGGEVEFVNYILDGNDCVFIIKPGSGKRIASIMRGDSLTPVNLNLVILKDNGDAHYTVQNVKNDFELAVTFEDDTEVITQASVTKAVSFSADTLANRTEPNVTVFSKVKVPSTETLPVEYGILFSYEEGADFSLIGGDKTGNTAGDLTIVGGAKSGTKKFKALGKGYKGNFAVQLIDNENKMLEGQKYYIKSYVVIDGQYSDADFGPETVFNK